MTLAEVLLKSGWNQAQIDALDAKALSGLDISGTLQGQASAKGVTISWSYDPNANTLTLQCLQKPWYVAASIIESKLDDLVAGINRGTN